MNNINVKVLIDNNAASEDYLCEHGLSMVITRGDDNILLDFGLSNNMYTNAEKLDVDMGSINAAIISHAHYDHTGGLYTFTRNNPDCPIYVRQGVDDTYLSKRKAKGIRKLLCNGKDFYLKYIGLSRKSSQCIKHLNIINEDTCILPGVHILCDKADCSMINTSLFKKENNKIMADDFKHESILVIEEDECIHVFTGCCHRGVKSTLDYVASRFDKPIISLVGGLHLVGRDKSGINTIAAMSAAEAIKNHNIKNIFVGHCTKDKGYQYLKARYNQTQQFSAGFEFSL